MVVAKAISAASPFTARTSHAVAQDDGANAKKQHFAWLQLPGR